MMDSQPMNSFNIERFFFSLFLCVLRVLCG